MPQEPRIIPPIVVAEGWDVTVYETSDHVLRHIEPWFPSSVDYRAFDSEGRRLELVADPPVMQKRLIGPIRTDDADQSSLFIRAIESEPTGLEELSAMLEAWLQRVGVPLDLAEDWTLDQLLAKAMERDGFTR